MSLSINTNVASLTAQRAMYNSNSALETSFERLSTGKRINSAVDDAAGMSIGKGLESHVNGLNQAVRNVNDGISMVQIAEGTMDEVTTILQRMRDLAVQASNGSLSSTEQGYLDAEHAKLAETLGKVIDQSQFNGTDLVSDSANTSIVLQTGADSADTTTISFSQMTELSLGVDAAAIDLQGDTSKVASVGFAAFEGNGGEHAVLTVTDAVNDLASGGTGNYVVEIDGNTFTTGSITAPADMDALVVALNAMSGLSNLGTFSTDANDDDLIFTASGSGAVAASTVKSEGFDTDYGSGTAATFTNTTTGTDYTAASTDVYTLTVGTATVVASDTSGNFTDNKDIAAALQAQAIDDGITNFTIGTTGGFDNGVITLTYTSGTESETTYTLAKTTGTGGSSVSGTETDVDVASANDAISKIDAALATVASERASLGATQSQLESTVRNLANVAENTSAAAGRIMDTDYAAETANLTKAQILQQAATSILAQANAQPQSVLSLLQ